MKSKPRTQRNLIAAAVCVALQAGPANALELGVATVTSSIGERLAVSIPLRSAQPLAQRCVSVSTPAGAPAVPGVRATLVGNTVSVTSRTAIREPLLEIIVRAGCPGEATLIRTYPLMLDLPAINAASYAERRDARTDGLAQPAAPNRVATRRGNAPAPRLGSRYRVRSGDTLSAIAQRVDDPDRSLWASVDAIFRANPDAFIEGNPDRLKAGAVLVLPSAPLPALADTAAVSASVAGAQTVADSVTTSIVAGGATLASDAATDPAGSFATPGEQSAADGSADAADTTTATATDAGNDYADTVFSVINGTAARSETQAPAETAAPAAAAPWAVARRTNPDVAPVASEADAIAAADQATPSRGSGVLTATIIGIGAGLLIGLLLWTRRSRRDPQTARANALRPTEIGFGPDRDEAAPRARVARPAPAAPAVAAAHTAVAASANTPAAASPAVPEPQPRAPVTASPATPPAAPLAQEAKPERTRRDATDETTAIDVRAIPEFTATITTEAPQVEEQTLLEQDYEEEFSRTQQMRKQLASEAMKKSLAALTDDTDDTVEAPRNRRLTDNLTDDLFDTMISTQSIERATDDTAPLQPIVHDECTESTVALPGPIVDEADDDDETYVDDLTLEFTIDDEPGDDQDETIASQLDDATRELERTVRTPRKKRA